MTVRALLGDCRVVLPAEVAPGTMQTCVTSPPYWGLRDYDHPEQLGLEHHPEDYLAHMVDVFRHVRTALRKDGTLWLNMGDSYTDTGRSGDGAPGKPFGLGRKQLLGMPWRLALALQTDGWFLRRDIIWHKTNPMPESCKDRPTGAHEYLFLFSKRATYYYDAAAIKEPVTGRAHRRKAAWSDTARDTRVPRGWDTGPGRHAGKRGNYKAARAATTKLARRLKSRPGEGSFGAGTADLVTERNKRSVWTIPCHPFKGAHFATFPPALVRPCILAGSRPGDWVLDPFGGALTTALVADQLERHSVMIDVNPDYLTMGKQRLEYQTTIENAIAIARVEGTLRG